MKIFSSSSRSFVPSFVRSFVEANMSHSQEKKIEETTAINKFQLGIKTKAGAERKKEPCNSFEAKKL